MSSVKLTTTAGNGGTVELKGPANTTSNAAVQLTLPVDDGTADQYLKTDGSGALSWSTVSAGTALTGSTNNTVCTVTGANAIAGEANLTFDGTHLGVGTSSPAVVSGGPGLVVHGTTAPRIRLTNDTTGEAGTDGAELSIDGTTKDFWIENREDGDMIFGVNGGERARITPAGNFYIGQSSNQSYTDNPAGCTEITCDQNGGGVLRLRNPTAVSGQQWIRFNNGSNVGGIQRDGTTTGAQFFSGSDRRIKKNIADMPGTLDKLNQIQLKTFDLKDDSGSGVGPIAQDLVNIFPGKVNKDSGDDGTGDTVPDGKEEWSVGNGFTWELIKAVQELTAKNTALEARIAALEAA